MAKELSGFKKSAPISLPTTRDQNPESAWDIDLSPFHRMVDAQATVNREMTEAMISKLDELLQKIPHWIAEHQQFLEDKSKQSSIQQQVTAEEGIKQLQTLIQEIQRLQKMLEHSSDLQVASIQQHEQIFNHLIQVCQQMSVTVENIGSTAQYCSKTMLRLEDFFQRQEKMQRSNNILFWIFVSVAFAFFLWIWAK